MNHIQPEDEGNAQTAILYCEFLYVTDALYPRQVEDTSYFTAFYLSGDVTTFGLSGYYFSGDGKIELPDPCPAVRFVPVELSFQGK